LGFSCVVKSEYGWERESDGVANLIDGADSPCKTDQGEGGVDVEGKLSSISTCTREEGNKAVNTSDLVENLRKGVSRAGIIGGLWVRTAKRTTRMTPVLRSRKPSMEAKGRGLS
jgi:hypothetical protein